MKFMGAMLVLIMIVFGLFCVWISCEVGYEMITVGAVNRVELVMNWFMAMIVLVVGLLCFATAPLIIEEM